jgi:hypothetical protein
MPTNIAATGESINITPAVTITTPPHADASGSLWDMIRHTQIESCFNRRFAAMKKPPPRRLIFDLVIFV